MIANALAISTLARHVPRSLMVGLEDAFPLLPTPPLDPCSGLAPATCPFTIVIAGSHWLLLTATLYRRRLLLPHVLRSMNKRTLPLRFSYGCLGCLVYLLSLALALDITSSRLI